MNERSADNMVSAAGMAAIARIATRQETAARWPRGYCVTPAREAG